jgi:NitT/TauT family transport system substrate-binding protein
MIKVNRRQALALMGATLAAGSLGAPAFAANTKIKIGALRFTSHAASFIAFERGYFADAGLEVECFFSSRATHGSGYCQW